MTGLKPMNCAVGQCASSFMYKDECALVSSGCCARTMLDMLASQPDGAHFPMDLTPGGNPFIRAMEAAGLVHVDDDVTRLLRQSPPPSPMGGEDIPKGETK